MNRVAVAKELVRVARELVAAVTRRRTPGDSKEKVLEWLKKPKTTKWLKNTLRSSGLWDGEEDYSRLMNSLRRDNKIEFVKTGPDKGEYRLWQGGIIITPESAAEFVAKALKGSDMVTKVKNIGGKPGVSCTFAGYEFEAAFSANPDGSVQADTDSTDRFNIPDGLVSAWEGLNGKYKNDFALDHVLDSVDYELQDARRDEAGFESEEKD